MTSAHDTEVLEALNKRADESKKMEKPLEKIQMNPYSDHVITTTAKKILKGNPFTY
jgi:hypothetical protein